MEAQEVSTKALTIIEQANAVIIRDSQGYTAAAGVWRAIKDLKDQVNETFKPIIEKAHAAHKEALAQKAKIFDPLDAASRTVKGAMEKFDREQEAIRQAEQRRLEEITRKEAEERALLDAIAAEEEAKRNGATKEEAAQEAAAIIEQPVYVAPVVIPKAVPKMQGGPVYRTIWKARITNEAIIPRQYLSVDMVKINGVVRSLKLQHGIPGIEAYEERC